MDAQPDECPLGSTARWVRRLAMALPYRYDNILTRWLPHHSLSGPVPTPTYATANDLVQLSNFGIALGGDSVRSQ